MRFLLALLLSLLPGVALAAPLSFTIGTSEPVVVDTSGGTPLIWLYFGGGEVRAATYRAGSGTAALEFAYDIAAGDFAPAGIIAAGQIELAGGAIRDLAGNPLTLSFTPPDLSGVRVRTYRPVWTTDPITAANASAAAFEITKAPFGASFAWEITSDGGGSTSGSGTISAAPHPVAGLDLSALGDGTLTLSLTLTTAAGTSAPRTVTATKNIDWCDDPAALAAASPGAVCGDGSVYAGALGDNHLITTAADEGLFTWNKGQGIWTVTGATSTNDGLANTNTLVALADAGAPYIAANACRALGSEWYLPSRDELNVLYTNRAAIGGFDLSGSWPPGWYWSSSESVSDSSRYQRFSDGAQTTSFKHYGMSIRCVRRVN
ncbi:MAG: hypothetical protein RLZ26_2538 [Pseudomonadota bacterium]|jgi:hypothetical protein